MPKAGKFYCHYEDSEPNFTSPFVLDPELQFASLLSDFCTKYNSKHGSTQQLLPDGLQIKVGSKVIDDRSLNVTEHVSPGDDVYILGQAAPAGSNGAAAPTPSTQSQQASTPANGPAEPALPPIKLKVYVHYESAASEQKDPSATQAFTVTNAAHSVGELIEEFVANYNRKNAENTNFSALDPLMLCARTDSQVVVPARGLVKEHFKTGDDVWIVSLETALKEDNAAVSSSALANANAIEASKIKARDKSYYYWQHKATGEAPAPREAPKQIRTRTATTAETLVFKTISAYSFVDDDSLVKVYITMPGVGALAAGQIESEFAARSCSVRVLGYNGANHRLQVPKLSEEIIPEQSRVVIKQDSLIVRLAKVKKDHHWYELHKTKGIGED